MKIRLDKHGNGIHDVIEISVENIKSDDISFLCNVVRIVEDFNKEAIEKA